MERTVFAVSRRDLRTTQLIKVAMREEPGAVQLEIDRFALTANNVTYAAFGDRMSYWQHFPLDREWGSVPVWGFANVIRSSVGGVRPGERFYGYFPIASHVTLFPKNASAGGFADGAPHRQRLTAGYNQYLRVTQDPLYASAAEELQMLFRPLLLTAFVIDDYLFDNQFFGAKSVILSSASSKTSYAAAYLLSARRGVEVIGLTSARNVGFVRGLGCYHRVLIYDEIADAQVQTPVAFIDMAANATLRETIHSRFSGDLKLSCAVGATNWDRMQSRQELPGPKPLRFFVPTQVEKRFKEWGADGFHAAYRSAWTRFMDRVRTGGSGWLVVRTAAGEDVIANVWHALVSGEVDPRDGHILSFAARIPTLCGPTDRPDR
jgi:hypothetical protein